jgi:hypothetical protein
VPEFFHYAGDALYFVTAMAAGRSTAVAVDAVAVDAVVVDAVVVDAVVVDAVVVDAVVVDGEASGPARRTRLGGHRRLAEPRPRDVKVFIGHGLVPDLVIAARPAGRPTLAASRPPAR